MHSAWQKEYRVYMGATPAQLGLDKLGAPSVLIEEADRIAQIERLMTDSVTQLASSRARTSRATITRGQQSLSVFYRPTQERAQTSMCKRDAICHCCSLCSSLACSHNPARECALRH